MNPISNELNYNFVIPNRDKVIHGCLPLQLALLSESIGKIIQLNIQTHTIASYLIDI